MKWVAVGFFYFYCVAEIIAQTIQIADVITEGITVAVVVITMTDAVITIMVNAVVRIRTIMKAIAVVMTMRPQSF